MARRNIGVLERLAGGQMCQAGLIMVPRISFWVMVPDPSPDLEEADFRHFGAVLRRHDVDIV